MLARTGLALVLGALVSGCRVRGPQAGTDGEDTPDTRVVRDVEGADAPAAGPRGLPVDSTGDRRRIQRIDEEDRRPGEQLTRGPFTVGGELQYDLEWRKNHDLRDDRRRDRLIHELSLQTEVSADLGEGLFAFMKGTARRRVVGFDQDRDFEFGTEVELNEAFVLFENVLATQLTFQLGRQDFDHGREWLMDANLDAVRAYLGLADWTLQASVSSVLADAPAGQDDVVNVLVGAEWGPARKTEFFFYALHRHGGRAQLDRTHLGLSFERRHGAATLWSDLAVVTGREQGVSVRGAGVDLAAMYEFEEVGSSPYVYAGFAFGSGDPDRQDGVERGFRQSGLQDNNDRFGGVASFRYLGELFQPELSNLMVFTLGAGFRPFRRTSIDLVYHHYRQVEAAPLLRDTRIRLDPNGMRSTLGDEIDLVLGIKRFHPLEIELDLGYFWPGGAFDRRDGAFFAAFEVEWNF